MATSERIARPTGPALPRLAIAEAFKSKIVATTGILLALAAMVNAAVDIVVAAGKLPRSDAEEQNIALFKKHFGKAPLADNALPIRSPLGVVQVHFRIFEGGDIHVEYGNNSRWFPLPQPEAKPSFGLFGFLPAAHAQDAATVPPASSMLPATQPGRASAYSEALEGSRLIRTQELAGGRAERVEYDIRSGRIVSRSLVDPEALRGKMLKAPPTTVLKEQAAGAAVKAN